MNASKYFDLRELVHPNIYNHPAIGMRSVNWIHPYAMQTLDALVEFFGEKPIINDWHMGGVRKHSGLRDWHDPEGASYSGHYFGGGTFDLTWAGTTSAAVYKKLLANAEQFPYISRMEHIAKTPTWNHVEMGLRRTGNIIIFNP